MSLKRLSPCIQRFIQIAIFPAALAACLCLSGCDAPYGPDQFKVSGCRQCHPVTIDPAHDLGCCTCHSGNPAGRDMSHAHQGLVAHPAAPGNMARVCGKCHRGSVEKAAVSTHFTLNSEIGHVWRAFFPDSRKIPLPQDLRVEEYPWSLQGLVADMLRKRCLRCHVWYEGDSYGQTRRGQGCAACHLDIASGNVPLDHSFRRTVSDRRCLSCHYGNFTGWDCYGRFEKDFPADFRAPLKNGHHIPRPYGVEWLDMTPDVHRQQGMECVACHPGGPCETPGSRPVRTCLGCHAVDTLSAGSPGHSAQAVKLVECTVCHALWAPVDIGRSLMRLDSPDYEEWLRLSVQGSSEVEEICRDEAMRTFDSWGQASMQDKIDGTVRPGMWFEGFAARRFWPVIIAETEDGRLVNARPLLDLSVSYLNSDDMIMADNIRPQGRGPACMDKEPCISRIATEFLPGKTFISFLEPELLERPGLWLAFTPHTVGPADVFRTMQVARWLEKQR